VSIAGEADSDSIPWRGYRPWAMWATVPVFTPVVWTPATFQAYLAGRAAFARGVASLKESTLRTADAAMKVDWPVPTFGPPGFDQAYRCPKCKKKGALHPATPTEFHKHVCKCGNVVENDPEMDRHWVRIYHGQRARDMKALALAWLFTGNNAYAEKAAGLLLGYAAAYNQMPIDGERSTCGRTRIGGRSLGSSYTTPHFAQAFYYLQAAPCLDAAKRETIRQLVKQMGVEVDQHSVHFNNQQAEHFNAYGCCGLATGFWPLAAEAVYGNFGWHRIVEYGYDEDGMGHEGSAYHRAIFQAMNEIAEFAYTFGLNLHTARYKRVFDGTYNAGMIAPWSGELELPYRVYMDPEYIPQVLGAGDKDKIRGRDLAVALYGVEGLPDPQGLPFASKLMANAGYVFLRQGSAADNLEIRLNYIKHFDRHERDRLTTFFYRNRRQVDATVGRISYGVKDCWWMNDTAGHNCIVIDGKNASEGRSRLLVFADNPETPLAVVRTDPETPLYAGVTQTRCIAILGRNYVVFDRVVCAEPHTVDRYQWGTGAAKLLFETKPADPLPGALPKSGRFEALAGGPCGQALRIDYVVTDPKDNSVKDALKMRLACDQAMSAYRATSWGGYNGDKQEATFARVEPGKEVTFLAAFSLGAESEPAAVEIRKSTDAQMVFAVKPGDKTYVVSIDADARTAAVAVE